MVARSAYAQLRLFAAAARRHRRRHGADLSGAAAAGAVRAPAGAQMLGLAAWALMAIAFQPTLRFYGSRRCGAWRCPRSRLLYMLYTLDSAYQYAARQAAERGRGACRPSVQDYMTDGRRTAFGQGPPRREFPGRVVADPRRAIAAPILAFYEFVRIADDIADHATLQPDEKLAQLDRLEGDLLGSGDDDARGRAAARGARRARPVAAPRAGPARRRSAWTSPSCATAIGTT